MAKNGNPFTAIDKNDEWVSMGIKQGFRYQVEEAADALELSLSTKMVVHLVHNYVQQMLKLHRMMDRQFCDILLCWGLDVMKLMDTELSI
jgi:hypothetical protein